MEWFVLERTIRGSGLYFSNTRLTSLLAAIFTGVLPSLNKIRVKHCKNMQVKLPKHYHSMMRGVTWS